MTPLSLKAFLTPKRHFKHKQSIPLMTKNQISAFTTSLNTQNVGIIDQQSSLQPPHLPVSLILAHLLLRFLQSLLFQPLPTYGTLTTKMHLSSTITPPPQSPIPCHSPTPSQTPSSHIPPLAVEQEKPELDLPPLRRTTRERKTTVRLQESLTGAQIITTNPSNTSHTPSFAPPQEPQSLEELSILPSPRNGVKQFPKNSTPSKRTIPSTLSLHPPANRKVIGTKFVCKLKDQELINPRYKAQFVAKDYTQIPGIDYTDTFAPVFKATSIRFVLVYAVLYGLPIHQFVETAFIDLRIDQIVYVEQPPHFAILAPIMSYNSTKLSMVSSNLPCCGQTISRTR